MWFKNLQVYRLPANWDMTAERLADYLASQTFSPCTSSELQRQGWASPRDNGQLVHTVNRQMLLCLQTEKKLLPASVISQVAKAKAAELEEAQGFAPGRKAMKELRERVADELLPRAFGILGRTYAWIDPVNGWLVVDAASASKADEVVKMLLKTVDRMPLESLRVARSPVAMMTAWLEMDEAPAGFTVDQDAIMQAAGESKASVRYVKHTLEVDDLRRHIAAGKQCKRLAITWGDKISFVLDQTLAIKSIKPLDVIKENDASVRNDEERFDNDMMLMTGELSQLLADLVKALGGEADDLVSAAQKDPSPALPKDVPAGDGSADDPLYGQAKQIILSNRRASISLVQRHLCIGYNRAARLLEALEVQGVLGAMQSNGNREILQAGGEAA